MSAVGEHRHRRRSHRGCSPPPPASRRRSGGRPGTSGGSRLPLEARQLDRVGAVAVADPDVGDAPIPAGREGDPPTVRGVVGVAVECAGGDQPLWRSIAGATPGGRVSSRCPWARVVDLLNTPSGFPGGKGRAAPRPTPRSGLRLATGQAHPPDAESSLPSVAKTISLSIWTSRREPC